MEVNPQDAGGAGAPLWGIRVLDFSAVVSGPLCAQILGDLGADVVKVETPRGDATRMMGPPFKGGLTGIFAQFNRNKRSIVLDLKQREALEIARRLASQSDVLLQNFRPGVLERLGLGYAELSAQNARLIYVAISGFGPEGPYADYPAYDTVVQGLVGMMPIQGGEGAPQLFRNIVADKSSGLTAAYAVMAALFARERGGGRGQSIDVPMLDSYAAFILPDALGGDTFLPPDGGPALNPSQIHRTWATADGHVVMMVIEDHQFQGMCRVLDREDLIADPRFGSFLGRISHAAELYEMLEAELEKRTTAEVVARARAFGVPLSPANGIREFLEDPQVAANRTVFEAEHPELGRLRFLRNPVRFQATPASFRRHPPRLGEHTDEILREAGLDPAEIARLRAAGAVR